MDKWHWLLLALVDHRFGGRPGRLLPAGLQLPTAQGMQLRSNLLRHRASRHVPTLKQLKNWCWIYLNILIKKETSPSLGACHRFQNQMSPEASWSKHIEKRIPQLQVAHTCLLWPKTHLHSSSKEFHCSPGRTGGCQDTDLMQPVGDTYVPHQRSVPSECSPCLARRSMPDFQASRTAGEVWCKERNRPFARRGACHKHKYLHGDLQICICSLTSLWILQVLCCLQGNFCKCQSLDRHWICWMDTSRMLLRYQTTQVSTCKAPVARTCLVSPSGCLSHLCKHGPQSRLWRHACALSSSLLLSRALLLRLGCSVRCLTGPGRLVCPRPP